MADSTDIRVTGTALYFIPVQTRVPLKFGPETLTSVTCARVRVTVADRRGRTADGWGETPLSVQWVWPSTLAYEVRHQALRQFCLRLAEAWAGLDTWGHPIEIGHDFQQVVLRPLWDELRACQMDRQDAGPAPAEPMPWLAALICCSPFDIALHDAYGRLHGIDVYQTYRPPFMNRDLAAYLSPADDLSVADRPVPASPRPRVSFSGRYPADYLAASRQQRLLAWHLVGGVDLLDAAERTDAEPDDGYPVVLADWIRRDGLTCLKIKLRGTDAAWDYERLVRVGRIAVEHGVERLSADFNCTDQHPVYENDILD
ncbi:MAG: hypothetical protein HY718_10245, partial [Planctomycetes bacterium]|nr:hypothetical protein [Planctomycetota bacterium]